MRGGIRPGDINVDVSIALKDVMSLVDHTLKDTQLSYASEMNGDRVLNILDVILLVKDVLDINVDADETDIF